MSNDQGIEGLESAAGNDSISTTDMSDKARQSSLEESQVSEGDDLSLPKSLDREADEVHGKEKRMNEETPSGSVVEEYIHKEQTRARPLLRSDVSSFAAPTKASEAKKNEKIELAQFVKKTSSIKEPPGRLGFATQWQSASIPNDRRPSLQQRSVTNSTHTKDDDHAVGSSLPLRGRPAKRHDGTRSGSLSSARSDRSSEEEIGEKNEGTPTLETELKEEQPEVQKEEKLEAEVIEQLPEEQAEEDEVQADSESSAQEEKELEEVEKVLTNEEPLESCVEETKAEFDESQQQEPHLTKDVATLPSQENHGKNPEVQATIPRDQIISISRRSTDEDKGGRVGTLADIENAVLGKVVAEKEELQAILKETEKQREAVEQDLQSMKENAEKLKQEHDILVTQLRESQELIEARNTREPNLPPLEAVEAENKRLQLAINKTQKDFSEANACCKNLDDQLKEVQEKQMSQETSIKELCGFVDLVSQSMDQGVDIGAPKPDELPQDLTLLPNIEKLQVKIAQLFGRYCADDKKWRDKNEELQRELADKESEIARLEKTMDYQQKELLSPGLQSPMFLPSAQTDKPGFKEFYQQERSKRKGLEQELAQVRKLLSDLQPEHETLQSNLDKAQEELADLRPKVDKLEGDARGWRQDSEEKTSQLEERTRAFETSSDQQKQETLRYIKDYYNKTKDKTYWEVQGLQKKLGELDEERVTLKRAFERAKVENARLGDGVTRLRKSNQARDTHIGDIQQAFIYGQEFPTLPPDDDDISSPTSTSTTSPLDHPLEFIRRPPPIPRCHLPTAINAREATIAAFRENLDKEREQELFNVSVKPSAPAKKWKSDVGRDEIMEKVRKWKMGSSYPPGKPGWSELRRKSAWERWDGETWAKEAAVGKDVDVLKERGLWKEAWD
jgi:peptidoglycan hydrolase CwlO-like protein